MTVLGAIRRSLHPATAMSGSASPWEDLERADRTALARSWGLGVPPAASAIHARWWQLENWLRSLVYVELRACYGRDWVEHLSTKTLTMTTKDQQRQTYMSTPDATSYLAFLDVGELFTIIKDNWTLFRPSMIDNESAWLGRVAELQTIRRRMAHCRRPHSDDLGRLEQTLRDLEKGALRALVSVQRHTSAAAALG